MTITNEFQAGKHAEQAHAYADLLWHLAQADKRAGSPSLAADRCASVDRLCEAHYAQVGQMPDSNVLERLASLILFDELTDDTPYKTRNTEYPIESEHKEKRHNDGITSASFADTVGIDGRDYRTPHRRKRTPSENAYVDRNAGRSRDADGKTTK